ncbi:hypothetical protein Aduo_015598 [Ancylostoma duodenale]
MRTVARISVTIFALLASTVNIYMLVFMYGKEGNSTRIQESLNSLQQLPQRGRAERFNVKSPCHNERPSEELTLWSGILDFFPDLRNVSQNDLQPVLLTSRNRVRKKLMVGIPVAKRSKDYTVATLSSLFAELDDDYREDIVFLVMFATTEEQFIQNRTKEMQRKFSKEISAGVLEIIAVPPVWYKTDVAAIPATFNDSLDRMFWRTKQNIDYIYIMTYASQRCEYYMQLEDDVVAAASYARVLFNYIAVKSGTEWFVISFSTMGFIGKLFSGASLKYMTYAIALYYRYKPVDWIFEDVLRSRYCSLDKSSQDCTQAVSSHQLSSGASQFQHVGQISSLSGKIQKIHDGNFNKGLSQGIRRNPPATIAASMAASKHHDVQTAYKKNVAMWLINPRIGDYISIAFNTEVNITGVMFLSGVPPAPKDKLGPEGVVSIYDSARREISIGQFSHKGDFVFRSSGMVAVELRIKITANISHWITIDHITIDVVPTAEHNDENATTLRSS